MTASCAKNQSDPVASPEPRYPGSSSCPRRQDRVLRRNRLVQHLALRAGDRGTEVRWRGRKGSEDRTALLQAGSHGAHSGTAWGGGRGGPGHSAVILIPSNAPPTGADVSWERLNEKHKDGEVFPGTTWCWGRGEQAVGSPMLPLASSPEQGGPPASAH